MKHTEAVLAFHIQDVMRQIASIQAKGEAPLRVRFSEAAWREVVWANGWLTAPPDNPTFCGLPVRVDPDYEGPPAVETRTDQVRPTGRG